MKSPRIAAALVAFSLLFALAGIITSMKKASFLNLKVMGTLFPGVDLNVIYVVSFGNTQIDFISATATLNGQDYPLPGPQSLPNVTRINSACPNINGTESCSLQDGPPGPGGPQSSDACLPSSAWALVVVSQVFASIAIIVQAAIAFALFMAKGSRMIHQILSVIAAVALLISVSSVMNVPARFYSVCLSPTAPQSFTLSASYAFDAGGELPARSSSCTLFILR
jgi:hypothetical protein